MLNALPWWFRTRAVRQDRIRAAFERFQSLITRNAEILERIAEAEEMLGGEYVFDRTYLQELVRNLTDTVDRVVLDLNAISGNRYLALAGAAQRVRSALVADLEGRPAGATGEWVLSIDRLNMALADMVGEKAARLGEVRRRTGCGVPAGFAVTVAATRRVLERAGLSPDAAASWSDDTVRAVVEAGLPRDIERAVRRAVSTLEREAPGATGFAVRSSALGEDGSRSFAGQFLTLLNVPAAKVPNACVEVIASLFHPVTAGYRSRGDIPKQPRDMAVLVQPMVSVRAAGVLYSLDPVAIDEERMVVAAAPGLGSTVVHGGDADRFVVSRTPPHPVIAREIAQKDKMIQPASRGGVEQLAVPETDRSTAVLDDATLAHLAEMALTVERVLRFAVDMEWAIDGDGGIHVLQARSARLRPAAPLPVDLVRKARLDHRVLIEETGSVACRGIGAGPVHVVAREEDCSRFPPGAVLVAHDATPLLSSCVARASAVVTDSGAALSHLGTVTREFRVPALFGTGFATRLLGNGMPVTVDAEEGVVYEGEVRELLRHQLLESASGTEAPEFHLLRRILRRVSPLHLVDPKAPEFTPEHCRTIHDILRLAHEKAVEEISTGLVKRANSPFVKELILPIPLDLVVVDAGGAFEPGTDERKVRPEALACIPLVRLIEGLTDPGAWGTGPSDLDLEGFFSSALRTDAVTGPASSRVERNVAVATRDYMNLNLKLGYHFQVLDCRLGDEEEDNRVFFFFVGGVTELERRARRAMLLGKILEAQGFTAEIHGDVVAARLSQMPRETVEQRIRLCGRLIGFTRQLDVSLKSDGAVDAYAKAFFERGWVSGSVPESTAPSMREEKMNVRGDVLVLDDEATVCERLQEYLTDKGFRVETFTESARALERMSEKTFDVVVTDLKMKAPTGMEVLRAIRQKGLPTEVIMITGYGSFVASREAEYSGVFEFVPKPFRMEGVAKLVAKASRKARRAGRRA